MAGIEAGEGAAAAPPPEQRVEQVRRVSVFVSSATPLRRSWVILSSSAPRSARLVFGGNIMVYLVVDWLELSSAGDLGF